MFKTRYRIVGDRYAGYEAQYKLWWLPFWLQMGINTHMTADAAEAFIRRLSFCKEIK